MSITPTALGSYLTLHFPSNSLCACLFFVAPVPNQHCGLTVVLRQEQRDSYDPFNGLLASVARGCNVKDAACTVSVPFILGGAHCILQLFCKKEGPNCVRTFQAFRLSFLQFIPMGLCRLVIRQERHSLNVSTLPTVCSLDERAEHVNVII